MINLFVLSEHHILVTSKVVTNSWPLKSLSKAIGIINFAKISKRSSNSLNLELPTEMAEIKVAKKTLFFPRKDSWSIPQISPKVIFTLDKY